MAANKPVNTRTIILGASCITCSLWGVTVPLMLFASRHVVLFILMVIFLFVGLGCGHTGMAMMVMQGVETKKRRLVTGCVFLLSMAGALIFIIGHGSFYFFCMRMNVAEGVSVGNLKDLSDDGVITVFCDDGFVPAERLVKPSTAKKEMTSMTGKKYMLWTTVAPIYRDTHELMMEPAALAIKYAWTDGDSKDPALTIPSPGPACGNHGRGGVCGFTVSFIDVQTAWTGIRKDDVVGLVHKAALSSDGWNFASIEDVPVLVIDSPADVFGEGASMFILGFILLAAGSPLGLPCICLIAKAQKVANPTLGESLSSGLSHTAEASGVQIQAVGKMTEFGTLPRQ
eukprot:gnl/MRDRNA2_/MRDRNA2_48810_c0_seq1.p1 gnl/MRDRNA2_/MRDRNA2_48810_c0~~gnl/MRDRNA2_/MRDRNA2_48810_c0_seq1.p1  ORF type:complete len:375 (+),score=54.76 gnl/MRDRNA2_/MRDRNA2_48810_c0_seq1:102-1127(+)